MAASPTFPLNWLTAEEAAAYLRFEHASAMYRGSLRALGMERGGAGGRLLWHTEDLDRWMRGEGRHRDIQEAERASARPHHGEVSTDGRHSPQAQDTEGRGDARRTERYSGVRLEEKRVAVLRLVRG